MKNYKVMRKNKKALAAFLSVLMVISAFAGMSAYADAATLLPQDETTISTYIPPENSDEYATWKESLIENHAQTRTASRSMLAISSTGMVSNDFVEFYVGSDGRFTIGTTGGNPGISTDDYKKLLYGHPSSGTSYTTIRVDGENNIFTPDSSLPASSAADLNNVSTQMIGNISITQELKIINNNSTGRDDRVQIQYTVKNNDSAAHTIGTRIMMDTQLAENDAAPFRVPGVGTVTQELELSGQNIPEYWQAFDNISTPGVVSQGSFYTPNLDNSPDRVQFTNWGRVYSNEWGYRVNPGAYNGDSAVSVIWDEKSIAPGSTIKYTTYYGLGDLTGNASVVLSGATSLQFDINSGLYSPDPFTVSSYIGNDSLETLQNARIRIILPEGLILDSNTSQTEEVNLGSINPGSSNLMTSWIVATDPNNRSAEDRTLSYSVALSADNMDTRTVSRNIFIPAYQSLPTQPSFSYFNMTGNAVALNGPTDSVIDSEGNLYLTDYYNNRVVEYNASGEYIRAYGSRGSGIGQFIKPSGMAIDLNGFLYVADTYNNRIVKFKDINQNGTIEAEEWQTWGQAAGNGNVQFNKPMGVYVKGTEVYVADTYNYRIAHFDYTDAVNTWESFGVKGSGTAQFILPYDVAVDSQDNIIVSDTFNNRVQKFASDATYIEQYIVNMPYGLSIDNNDNIYVAERMTGFIKCVNKALTFGGKGTTAGLFTNPVGVNVDARQRLWIVDVTSGKIQYAQLIR